MILNGLHMLHAIANGRCDEDDAAQRRPMPGLVIQILLRGACAPYFPQPKTQKTFEKSPRLFSLSVNDLFVSVSSEDPKDLRET